MEGYRIFRTDRPGRRTEGAAFYMKEHLECLELCLREDEEPNENLCVRIKERTGRGDIIVDVS